MELTFKEYLQSTREQLEEALRQTPSQFESYAVTRYCRLMVGEDVKAKQPVQLKPKHELHVKWLYEDMSAPTPLIVRFSDVKSVDADREYDLYWTNEQLVDWLSRNTRKV